MKMLERSIFMRKDEEDYGIYMLHTLGIGRCISTSYSPSASGYHRGLSGLKDLCFLWRIITRRLSLHLYRCVWIWLCDDGRITARGSPQKYDSGWVDRSTSHPVWTIAR